MKPSVITNANGSASTGGPQGPGNGGVTIPINHDYSGHQQQQQPQYHTQAQHYVGGEPHPTAYGSPGSHGRAPQQQQQQPHPQQQIPAHFQQDFDFEPDMGMDMFPRSRLAGRMGHDPFGDFGGTSHFGFPQFNSLGRRRANNHNDDDFFNRLPSEFRQYIPESFAHRRAPGGMAGSPGSAATGPTMVHPQQQHQQPQMTPQQQQQYYNTMPQSPSSKKVCDAAIQTEDPTGRSVDQVDHAVNTENLNQHGLRNTMDMGVKSAAENEMLGPRSTSAPPTEQQQQQQYTQQQIPVNGKRPTPPPHQQQHQFGTQTSPQVQTGQPPQFQKAYYPPQQQSHPQQKQQTPPPPQTPGGTYIRTIPIFVEGRSEPIINNKEIPNQNAAPSAAGNTGRGFTPPRQTQPHPQQQQQSHRPTPLNTQQQPTAQQYQQGGGLPPQTPHTVDTINKIQDIQRDVLALMSRVEQFTGTRADKEYAYLDEMLTRNLLKLDNIDTNGKESIRLARKEAIKCIEASINVLEAKAEENKRANDGGNTDNVATTAAATETAEAPQKSSSGEKVTKETAQTTEVAQPEEAVDVKQIHEPIPLPPPESQKFNMVQIEDCPEDEPISSSGTVDTTKESSPKPAQENAAETK